MKGKPATPLDIQVGKQIRRRRQSLKLSQSAVGKMIDVTYQQVQKYEDGMNRVNPVALQKLAVGMGVPISYFFADSPATGGDTHRDILAALDGFVSSPEGERIILAFMKINDARRRQLAVEVIEAIAAPDI